MSDSSIRTLAKTISWRIVATIATFIVSYLVSDDVSIAGTIAGSQILIHTTLYLIHERFWNKVTWGKI